MKFKKRYIIIPAAALLAAAVYLLLGSAFFAKAYVGFCARGSLRRAGLELSLASGGRPDMSLLTKAAGRLGEESEGLEAAAAAELKTDAELLLSAVTESGTFRKIGREKREAGGKKRTYTVYGLTIPREVFAEASSKMSLDATEICLKTRLTESVEKKLAELLPFPLSASAIHRMAAAAVDVVFPKISDGKAAESFMRDTEVRFYTRFGTLYAIEGETESLAGIIKNVSFELRVGDGGPRPLCSLASVGLSGVVGEKELSFSADERVGRDGGKLRATLGASASYGGSELLAAKADMRHTGGKKFSVEAHTTVLEDYERDYDFTGEVGGGAVTLYGSDGSVIKKIEFGS